MVDKILTNGSVERDVFGVIAENKGLIDDYFWKYYENITDEVMTTFIRDVCDFFDFGGCLLSIGCGHGLNEIFLSEMCGNIEEIRGVDIDETKIMSMNKIVELLGIENVVGIQGDGMALGLPDEAFDCVMLIESLSHIDHQNLALSEALRVLKKDGKILVIDYNNGANLRRWFRSWKLRYFEKVQEDIVNPYRIRNVLKEMGCSNILMEPHRHYRSFNMIKQALESKGIHLPSRFYLFVSKGFMLKAVKY